MLCVVLIGKFGLTGIKFSLLDSQKICNNCNSLHFVKQTINMNHTIFNNILRSLGAYLKKLMRFFQFYFSRINTVALTEN